MSLADHHSEQHVHAGQSRLVKAPVDRNDRAGASALARYRARRAAEWRAWLASLPWRAVAVLGGVGGAGLVGSVLVGPGLGKVAGVLMAAGMSWGLRFRVSGDARAWRLGAKGERRTARILARLGRDGFVAFHDLAVPGSPANVDHLVIGPTGVFVIDSKFYRGTVRVGFDGRLWYGGRSLDRVLGTLWWEAQQVADALAVGPEIRVYPVLCMHEARLPVA
jgi:Nuclease-related domain